MTHSGTSLLAAGLSSVECPTLGPDGWIVNVCSMDRPEEDWPTRGGDISVTHPERPLQTSVLFSTSTPETRGIPAALAFGPDQAMYIADEGRRSIVRATSSGEITDVITSYRGERLNGPNDLTFDKNGDLYFTDPWTSSPRNPVAAVYGFDWDRRTLWQIDRGMQFANGIVVRDGQLYVAETFPRAVWVYHLTGTASVATRELFCVLPDVINPPLLPPEERESVGTDYVAGPDGLAFDAQGNLWVAHYGGGCVLIYDSRGNLTDILPVAGRRPTNLCFAGPDHSTLYVAIDDHGVITGHPLDVKGDRLNYCPSRVKGHSWSETIADNSIDLPGRRDLPMVDSPIALSAD